MIPLAHVATLFLGPLLMSALGSLERSRGCSLHSHVSEQLQRVSWPELVTVRNLVVAPISEEFVFRACMVPLLLLQACPI